MKQANHGAIDNQQLLSIIEMLYALDKIAPGVASRYTLLYGVEAKLTNTLSKAFTNPLIPFDLINVDFSDLIPVSIQAVYPS